MENNNIQIHGLSYSAAMKILLSAILFLSALMGAAQTAPVEKAARIVTYTNQVINTRYLMIRTDSLIYRDSGKMLHSIAYPEVKSLLIREGSSFLPLMGLCLGLGIVYGLLPGGGGILIGLAGGATAGLILAPFIKKPMTLVYYLGEWKVDKYRPG